MTFFEKGTVVELKSGGPAMTVQDVEDNRDEGYGVTVTCVWFDESKKLSSAGFPIETLQEPEEPTMPLIG